MALNSCDCPLPTAIGDITPNTCPDNFGQIQKVIFQRRGFVFDGTVGKDITLLADWQALQVAADDTKIYELNWSKKTNIGSLVYLKYRFFVDTRTNLPKRTEFYRKRVTDNDYILRTIKK